MVVWPTDCTSVGIPFASIDESSGLMYSTHRNFKLLYEKEGGGEWNGTLTGGKNENTGLILHEK